MKMSGAIGEQMLRSWVEKILSRFTPPSRIPGEARVEIVEDMTSALRRRIPSAIMADPEQLTARLDAIRTLLIETHRTYAWPTVNEVAVAADKIRARDQAPETNAEDRLQKRLEWLARWVSERRCRPPGSSYGETEQMELVRRGYVTAAELVELGGVSLQVRALAGAEEARTASPEARAKIRAELERCVRKMSRGAERLTDDEVSASVDEMLGAGSQEKERRA